MSLSPVFPDIAELRILLADDEPAILEVFGGLLEMDGHRVGTAANGVEALALFEAQHWDVVVTDRAMPGMDGLDLARKIKQMSPSTPVILVTGLFTASSAHVDTILQKPFTTQTLGHAIATSTA
jgi:CheY-like chemotaxis protein